jgi:3-oxoacyl-[acyl-carrier-protein] synthase-3
MDGRFVFKNAVTRMSEVMTSLLKRNQMKPEDLDFVVLHQANLRINTMTMNQLGLPMEKTHHTIEKFGNTTAATIPLTMSEALELGKIKRGDMVGFLTFGAGFTWGGSLLRY